MNYIKTLTFVKKGSIAALSILGIACAELALMATVSQNKAEAVVVTFDDIENTHGFGAVENGYGDLNWTNFGYVNQIFHPDSGYENGLASGEYTAFNWYAQPAEVTGELFNFEGTFLSAAWNNGLNVLVEGFSEGILKYSQNVVVNPSESSWFDFDYTEVDKVRFTSFGGVDAKPDDNIVGRNFVMDNFTYNRSNSEEVPEPITVLGSLVALGFGGIFYKKYSRR